MKKFVLLLLVILPFVVVAQQRAQYSMYMVNPYLVNPALVGSEDFIDVKVGSRQQWQGFEGAPRTSYLSVHAPINKPHFTEHHYSDNKNWFGLGGMVLTDVTGPLSSNNAYLTATYDFGITEGFGKGMAHRDGIRAVFGMSFGVNQWQLQQDQFINQDEIEKIAAVDPTVASALNVKSSIPDANVGAWVYYESFYVGLSAQQILANSIDFGDNPLRTSEAHLSSHYFITAGTMLPLDPLWDVYPSFMLKGVYGAPLSVDLNMKIEYERGKYWGGISYRHADALNVMLGMVYNYHYEIAYSYDFTTSAIRKYSNGSHEVVLGYRIGFVSRSRNAETHQSAWWMNRHKNKARH